jgi:hypothetical protein
MARSGRGWSVSIARTSSAEGGPPCCWLRSHGLSVAAVELNVPSGSGR